ncbi:SDR family NAD(P)-dependent oxidoreductase [Streptomyces sp. SHP 1-2]|uniref:SDR family NAD(P)-dependent oxidoreductase n=1 Tax=Streptomyces sp. SHP 1-2 TaxID=2769489 RepID=UPI002237A934|nr:SDR family NAD(P)-dependent oxidoreductase [Streptomyces sp. SHP 1-2]MCW5249582.1 SDR family NAD(P)-dependent oxidoreductase [Streptomyces sp. SHP 1-2]
MTPSTDTLRRLVLERVRDGRLDPGVAARLLARAGAAAPAEEPPGTVRFVPVWEPAAARPAGHPAVAAGDVLFLTDAAAPVPAGARALRTDGATMEAGDWTARLAAHAARHGRPRGLVLDLRTVEARHAVERALPLVRALIPDRSAGPLPLVFLTGPDHPDTAAALGALAQVAHAEDRRLRAVAVTVDTGPGGAVDAFEVAVAELAALRPGLGQVRHGAGGREVRVLRPAPDRAGPSAVFRDGGRYLVTGGTRGIGLRLAALLARDHRARLVLTGRSAPDPEQTAGYRRLEESGARIVPVRGDVTDPRAARAAVDTAVREFGGLDGVLHCAGLNEDAYLVNKDLASARRVLSVKLDGAAHLDRATAGLPLDLFALFSSTSAYFGAAGQSDYAAANRALGELAAARARRVARGSRHGASVAVAWPLWAEGGMTVSDRDRRVLEETQGMLPMPTGTGLRELSAALAAGEPEILLVHGRADRARAWVARVSREESAGAAEAGPSAAGDGEGSRPGTGREAARAAVGTGEVGGPGGDGEGGGSGGGDRTGAAEAYLLDLVTRTAKLPPGRLRADQEFSTFGVDSILIKKLTATLEDRFGDLPVTLLFEYRTVAELARYLVARHPEGFAPPTAPDAPGPPDGADTGTGTSAPGTGTGSPARPADTGHRARTGPPGELSGGLPLDRAVAVVGLAGRYPGGADLDEFWESLASGTDLITTVPGDRWDNDRLLTDRRGTPGAVTGRWGGFLDDVARFDPLFFAVSPAEAARLDPNERIFLEVAWSALEHAGYSRRRLHEATRTGDTHAVGVFVGVTGSQYGLVGAEQWGRGNKVLAHSMDYSIANRLSYVLDVHGPSMVVDTACSGSLTALHLACRSLLSGESRMAVTGGVNVNIHPIKYAALTDMRLLASDGRCRAFGADGDGFVPGEGAGALVLKRLSDALADGDRIHAVVRGTAVNHGGRSNGYTVPTPRAQGAVVSEALRAARVDARTIGCVEAHGTGTALGDPVEVEGLRRAFAEHTDDTGFCAIGSVKSNIGHLEAAAGVCGITKVVLQFAHRTLVPTLHSEPVNPGLRLETTPFRPQRTKEPWPAPAGTPRRAAVSSFGAGGANGHVVLEEWAVPQGSADDGRPYAVGLSARTPEQLRRIAERLVADLTRGPGRALRDIAFTLLTGRDEWDHRLAVVASSVDELCELLSAHLDGEVSSAVRAGRAGGDAGVPAVTAPADGPGWDALAAAWVAGAPVVWREAFGDPRPTPVPLPSYPFGGGRHWVDLVDEPAAAPGGGAGPGGREDTVPSLPSRTDAVIADHLVDGRAVVAGVVHLELARRAAGLTEAPAVFEDVRWRVPLVAGEGVLDATVRFAGDGAGRGANGARGAYEVRGAASGTVHSSGVLTPGGGTDLGTLDVAAVRARCGRRVEGGEVYGRARSAGLRYGPLYRGLGALYRGDGEAFGELSGPGTGAPPWAAGAALTDSALHAVQGVLPEDGEPAVLPASVSRIVWGGSALRARYVHVRLVTLDAVRGTARADVVLADADGAVLARFEGLRVARPAPSSAGTTAAADGGDDDVPLYRPVWRPTAPAAPAGTTAPGGDGGEASGGAPGPVLVLDTAHDHGLGRALAAHHRAAGHHVVRVPLEEVALSADAFARVLDEAGGPGTVWFLGGVEERLYSADDLGQLDEALDRGPVALFHLLRALDTRRAAPRSAPGGDTGAGEGVDGGGGVDGGVGTDAAGGTRSGAGVRVRVVTSGVQAVDEAVAARNPFAGGLPGLVATASRELASLGLSCVDVAREDLVRCARQDAWEELLAPLAAEPAARPAHPVALSGGVRHVRELERIDLSGAGDPPLREGGRYLVTGGAGGLGTVVAGHLARAHGARVLLTGRRPQEHLPERARALLSELPDRVAYAVADVTDEPALRRAVAGMREAWGGVDGVVHSAFVLEDRTLARMDEATLRASFGPKAYGTVVLHRVLADDPLDFFAVFSSAISFNGNAGQGNYAAASTFQDAYGRFLAARLRLPVRVLDWGLWGESGSVATDGYRAGVAARLGVEPLSDAAGLTALRRVLAGPAVQVAPVRLAGAEDGPGVRPAPVPSGGSGAVRAAEAAARRRTAEGPGPAGAEYFAALEPYARVLLRDAFLAHGSWPGPGTTVTRTALAERLGVPPGRGRLLDAALSALVRGGHLERGADGAFTVPATGPRVPDPAAAGVLEERLLTAHPHAGALVGLLRECARALPEVLTGRRDGLSVLFPGGGHHKLAPLYHDDPRSEHFNAVCAAAVAAHAERWTGEGTGRLRLLEVGAGTGGTARPVLEALRPFADRVDYAFTDLSPGLVRRARERFGEAYPYADFSVLDIAGDPVAQGFEEGAHDVVLAANVLHATRDVRGVVRAAARLLRPGGLLVVNEGTRVLDAVTMIFGLTEGWWAYGDGELRQPCSPLLTPGTWRSVLLDAGLRGVRTVGAAGPDDAAAGQHVFLAERDEWPVPVRRAPHAGGTDAGGGVGGGAVGGAALPSPAPMPDGTAPGPDAVEAAAAYLRGVLADVLRMDKTDLDPAAPLSSYGVDSLVALEAAERIEADLGTAPRHVRFESVSVRELAGALLETEGGAPDRFTGGGVAGTAVAVRPDGPGARPAPTGPAPVAAATAYLREVLASLLGMDAADLDPAAPLSSYGVDSLVAMEVLERVEARLGPVPRAVRFETASLDGVVEALLGDLSRPLDRLSGPAAATEPAPDAGYVPTGAVAAVPRAGGTVSGAPGAGGNGGWPSGTGTAPVPAPVGEAAAGPVPAEAVGSPHIPVPAAPAAVGPAAPAHPIAPADPAGQDAPARVVPTPTAEEPLAVVGFSGRFPGAGTPDVLWGRLRAGRRAVSGVPGGHWAADQKEGEARWGGFLDNVEAFDPLVFRMSPRDAERTDPQERLFLEAVWTALEDAGTTRAGLERAARATNGAGVGVFAGVMHSPYQVRAAELRGAGHVAHAHSAHWSVANRVSHVLGFTGPSLAVDTACSSSLTALHLACGAVRRGDCGAAVVGGVNLILDPSHHDALAGMRMLAPDGRSRSFDRDADGMVPGEGVGAVVLKPLAAALRDRDRVHGLVLGTAANANGATDSMVTPSADAQEELIRRALARAGVEPGTVQYVEAQATGSPLADPVEAAALARVFGGSGVAVGSVKPSLGHLEAASGMAQLIKVLLQMRHGELAPTLDCPRPVAEFDGDALRLVREPEPWPGGTPAAGRLASVSSFGAGGANAHAVLAGPPEPRPRAQAGPGAGAVPRLILLSARREEQLTAHAHRLRDHLAERGDAAPELADVARTLAAGREPLGRRLAVVAHDVPELVSLLDRHLAGERPDRVSAGHAPADADTGHTVAPGAGPAALAAAGAAWAAGARLMGAAETLGLDGGRIVSLPGYPFARTPHRLPAGTARAGVTDAPPAPAVPVRAPVPVPASGPAAVPAVEHRPRHPSVPEEDDVTETIGRMRATVVDAVAAVLGVRHEDIGLDEHLSDFGFDSVTVVELTVRVNAELGTSLNPADLYGFRDVGALIEALARQTSTVPQAPAAPPSPEPPAPAPDRAQAPARVPSPAPAFPPGTAPEPPPPAGTGRPEPGHPGVAEPVAIVGMAGAFPGSPDLASYWANLLAGRDLVEEIPAERFDWREIHGDPRTDPGRVPSRWGGFLADADRFDAGFFRISPREARLMDPQHRLFLQTVWRAVEDAGHDPASLAGTRTGVFVGCGSTEYATLLLESGTEIDGQVATGNAHSILANRVSFLLDLRGPSEPVDTACSSGLVAVHRAVGALRSGECSAAIAGGVNLTLTPTGHLAFGKSGMLALDGRCKSFDHRADGYVRGEGVGAVLLKPLSAALDDGDTVYAVIRGTAVNHGGRAASLTAPNPESQAAVITAAHRRGGTDASLVGYVEAHGTGTALGDPVELKGLTRAFHELGVGPEHGRGIALGSVKTNVGHLETAAGIAGLVKTVLAMRHGMLPPTLHLERPNPLLELADSPFHLVDSVRPWDRPRTASGAEAPRLAGISSFGFGGVNAHVVVEEFVDPRAVPADDGTPELFVLSARSDDRLREYATLFADRLDRAAADGADPVGLRALARTLRVGRPALERRLAVVTDSSARLAAALRAFAAGERCDVVAESTPAVPDRAAAGVLDADDTARVLELARSGDLGKAAALWVRGADLDWSALDGGEPWRRVAGLPTYPFARERHWFTGAAPTTATTATAPVPVTVPAATAPAATAGVTAPPRPTASVVPAPAPVTGPAPAPPAPPALPAPPHLAAPAPPAPARPATVPAPTAPPAPPASRSATAADGTAAPATAPAPGGGLAARVRVLLAEGIGLPPESVAPDRDLAAYGVDSISALRIMQRIQGAFGDHIPMAAIFECTTLDSLVRHLTDEYGVSPDGGPAPATAREPGAADRAAGAPDAPPTPAPRAVVVPFGEDGPGTPLYGLPGETGELTWLLRLRAPFAAQGPVRGVEFTTPAPRGTTAGHGLAELARVCVDAILAHRPAGPYRLAGHAVAARLAVEAARLLTDAGHEVADLVLLDAPGPEERFAGDDAADVRAVAEQFAAVWCGSPASAPPPAPSGTAADRGAALRSAVRSLSALPGVPLRGTPLEERLAGAADWRRVLRRAVGDTPVRPLAPAGRTAVLAAPGAGSWDRALVPPPVLLDAVEVPGGTLSREGAARLDPRASGTAPAPVAAARGVRTVPAADRSFLVPINRSGTRMPSYWVHHLFGDVSYCIYLSRYLGMEHPLHGLEQLDADLRFTEFPSIEAMAARYVAEIRAEHPEGPYVLGGASFGGILAFEMARQLVADGAEVAHLYLVDALLPGTGAWDGVDSSVITEENQDAVTLMLIGNSASQLWKAEPSLTIEELTGLSAEEAIDHVTRHVVEGSPAELSAEEVHRLVRTRFALLDLNGKLLLDYRARPFARPVPTTVFHATRGFSAARNPYGMPAIGRDDSDTTNGLGSLAGDDVRVHHLDADHFTIVLEENLRAIAEVVADTLPPTEPATTATSAPAPVPAPKGPRA